MSLTKKILKESASFPGEHKFGLTSQILRSVVSTPSNIAEGSGRGFEKEFNRFLGIALASSFELET
jgi:four helix bundle protein